MEFLCELPNEAYDFTWLINGKTAPEIGQEPLEERGITPHNTIVRENNRTFTAIGIDPRVENNITILLCLASFFDTAPLRSAEVTFRVQGRQQLALTVDCSTMFPTRSAGSTNWSGDSSPQRHPPSSAVDSSLHSGPDGLRGRHHWLFSDTRDAESSPSRPL